MLSNGSVDCTRMELPSTFAVAHLAPVGSKDDSKMWPVEVGIGTGDGAATHLCNAGALKDQQRTGALKRRCGSALGNRMFCGNLADVQQIKSELQTRLCVLSLDA